MKDKEPLQALRSIIDTVRVGLLSTVNKQGQPHSRWVTAARLPGDHRFVYCVTGSGSLKVADILENEKVTWSFQTPGLDEVVTLEGRAVVLDNPELKAQVLEALGQYLQVFWRVQPDTRKLVVIEIEIARVRLFRPMANINVVEEAIP